MATSLENQPFKNREHIKAEIRRCALFSSICQYFSFLFAVLGIIGEASNLSIETLLSNLIEKAIPRV